MSAATAASVSGQNNPAPVPQPNPATTNEVSAKMALSLDECLRLALKENLTLQVGDRVAIGDTVDLDIRSVGRLGIEDARYLAESTYGYYDPKFKGSGGQRYQEQPAKFDSATDRFIPTGTRWHEEFEAGFEGILPTGTRYELQSSLDRLSGTRFDDGLLPFPGFVDLGWQYSSDAHVSITQPLLRNFWIDSGRLNIKLRKKDLRIAEHSFRLLTMDVMRRVAVAYYDLAAAADEVKTREKALELASQLVSENKKKVEAGTIAPLEEREAESREATAKADLTAARFTQQESENALKGLITHDFASVQKFTLEPTEKLVPVYQSFNLPDAWRNGLENRPDYLLEKEIVEKRNIELQYRKNQLFPALDLVGTYGRNGVAGSTSDSLDQIADNRYPYYGGGLVLSFPLTFKADRADYNRTKIQQKMAILTLKQREDMVLLEIDTAVKRARSTYEKTESTHAARKFAEEALDAEQKKLDAGRSTSFIVLRLQKDLTDARAAEILAVADYNKSLHELYFREGTTLQRNKVDLEIK